MKNLDSWPRLAGAAADARDELRAIVPRLEQAIAEGAVSREFLVQLRGLAVRHTESLKAALKAPQGSRTRRRMPDSWRSGGLWAALEASEEGNPRKPRPGP